jgi:hypothetical protein
LAHRIVVLVQSIMLYNIKANIGKLNMNHMPVADNKVSNHIILRRHMQLEKMFTMKTFDKGNIYMLHSPYSIW